MEHNSEKSHEELVRLYETNGLLKFIDEYEMQIAK